MAISLLMQSFRQMDASYSCSGPQRGRSRTPKSKPIAMAFGEADLAHHLHSKSSQIPPRQRQRQGAHCIHHPPPPKGRSPNRSDPGALEDAILEAHARGDLRQCLQWVLELQGISLDWDDPRLDTATEDDLCFAESAGMGPDATPEERARAEQYWTMREDEEDEVRRLWELTATEEEKEASQRLRAQMEVVQRKRDARAQYFRMPRPGKGAAMTKRQPPLGAKSMLSRSPDLSGLPQSTICRLPRSRPEFLFPCDEAELSAVRSMWLDQGRRGLPIVERLIRPQLDDPSQSSVYRNSITTIHRLERACSSDNMATSHSASLSPSPSSSPSSSYSTPSALFSSIHTRASTATSISSANHTGSPRSPSKVSSPRTTRALTPAPATRKYVAVSSTECPLHIHASASLSLRETLEEKHARRRSWSLPRDLQGHVPRTAKADLETSWLRKSSKVVGGFVDLIGRLPTAYLPVTQCGESQRRTTSCPPSSCPRSLTLSPPPETYIYMLPLRPPAYPLVFPPIPTLPRSPYRPLVTPPQPTPRMRLVGNPHFLRLKALQNRVLWGLLQVPQAECEVLADITRRHQANAGSGRPDVDRDGHMFTAKEALLRVAVEGLGRSTLCAELTPADEAGTLASLWSWWPVRR